MADSRKDSLLSVDDTSRLERELRHIGSVIATFSYLAIVVSFVSMSVTAAIFFTSTVLSQDRKVFFLGILGVCFIGLLTVVAIARQHPTTLLLFNILLAIMSSFALGLSISYAS